MLLRFVVSNFLSIREELEFTMFPYTKLKGHTDHIYKTPKVDLLKVAAIYGANGSGKSNLIGALHYMQDIVISKSNRYTNQPIFFRLTKEYFSQPSRFEIEFKTNDNYYAYGLEIINNQIEEEWLYSIDPKGAKDQLVFSRKKGENGSIKLEVDPKYKKTEKEEILIQVYAEEVLTHKIPFIYQVRDKEQYPEIQDAYEWIAKKLVIFHPESRFTSLTGQIIKNEQLRKLTNELITQLDTGVNKVKVRTFPLEEYFGEDGKEAQKEIRDRFDRGEEHITLESDDGAMSILKNENGQILVNRLVTEHKGESNWLAEFGLDEESDGTRRLLNYIPAIERMANEEIVCVVDEIGRSLHPALLKEFLSFYLNQKTKGQFIFTTHESNLLDLKLFRQDEIWFVEKDETGSTKAYSLSEFKPRYDLDIRKGYLNGRFGAIPFLGNLEDLNWKDAEEEQRI